MKIFKYLAIVPLIVALTGCSSGYEDSAVIEDTSLESSFTLEETQFLAYAFSIGDGIIVDDMSTTQMEGMIQLGHVHCTAFESGMSIEDVGNADADTVEEYRTSTVISLAAIDAFCPNYEFLVTNWYNNG